MSSPEPIVNSEPPRDQGIPLDFQQIVDELRTQISDLSYQNTLLRLTIKQMQQ
jgi:hypothetical protein